MELFQKTTENIKKEKKALSVRKQVLTSLTPRPPLDLSSLPVREVTRVMMNMCFTMQVLERSLQNRISGYGSLRDTITTRACVYFTHYLAQRDYDGKLRFIHEEERLEIHVCVCVRVCMHACMNCFHHLCTGEGRCSFRPLTVNKKCENSLWWRAFLHHCLLHHVPLGLDRCSFPLSG